MIEESLLTVVRREFRTMRSLADAALSRLNREQFFEAGEDTNSAAIIVKHMAGNMRSRWRDFLTTDGEKPDRHRDTEFEILEGDTRESLCAAWEAGWSQLFLALKPLTEADLARTVTIRGEPHTVLQAIHRQLTHYSYHVGQIVHVAHALRPKDWESLSVAKGASSAFNEAPDSYLTDDAP